MLFRSDACPYDALRCGPDFELAHTSRAEPMIDLMAIAAVDRETEMTYVRRERDWAERAVAEGRLLRTGRLLPVLPPGLAAGGGNGHNGGRAEGASEGDGAAVHGGHGG